MQVMEVVKHPLCSHLASADGADTLHLPARLQLESSAALHLLIPELHCATLLCPDTHGGVEVEGITRGRPDSTCSSLIGDGC